MSAASTTQAAISMPFDEAMRIEAEIVPVLERAGLAFVAVHRDQARPRSLPHQRPLASGGKARAAEPAQAASSTPLMMVSRVCFPGRTVAEQL
jgi:hypothetical protein